jgi:two-component system phosphate regulon sensor histidine kinase PhoR
MATSSAKYYSVKLLLAALLVLGVGWWFGHPLLVGLAALAGYGVWNLFNIFRLKRWLQSPTSILPASYGIWADIFNRISRLETTSRKQQEQYKSVIRDFQSLTDALPDATLVIDQQGNLTWFNNTARRLLELKTPEDLGQSVTNLLRGSDFANWLAVQGEVQSKLEMASPVDENTWFNISAVNYLEGQRLLILQDVTDVHNIHQVRRDFVANISHELRTPLTVLLGYLEMMEDGPEESSGMVRKMRSQARQMQELLSDLLELSRLQSDRIVGEEEEVDVPAMLAQLREQVEEISRGRHQVDFDIAAGLRLRGIASDLESAFRNLMVNAINYTPEGGRISVRWASSGDGAALSVRDSGIGIPRRDIPRLTERFYRVAADRARASGGTGLGLSIVKHVLNAHQAKLQIKSELGEGSEFTCMFPESRIFYHPRPIEAQAS